MGAWFYYGTLRDADLFRIVANAEMGTLDTRPGHVSGYRAVRVADETYPGLLAQDHAAVEGLYAPDVPPWIEARIGFYEEDEYHCAPIEVRLDDGSRVWANVFMPNPQAALTGESWWLDSWREHDKQTALRLAAAWMSLFGQGDPERLHDAWEALKLSLAANDTPSAIETARVAG